MIDPLLIDGLDIEEPSAMFNFEQEPEENSELEIDTFTPHSDSDRGEEQNTSTSEEKNHYYIRRIKHQNINKRRREKKNSGRERKYSIVFKKKKSGKKLFQVTRLQNTIAATKKMAGQNERRLTQKEQYETKKLQLYEQDIAVKTRIATVLEKILEKMF
ncbi:unnamed protein product [Psylliodes chrysocephalus]|uniref:Uncharacterized protein n=1 Tax=Psylliodes chrysocephalus TaxID=3402493 RepID=A0A9P0GEG6_9CUCU|nr:unnamed protein product [Psylliodes chrysocephala]